MKSRLQRLMKLDDAIVDVGSSNVEDFLKMMQHYADSQEEFDLFVVPVVKDGKQQADTVNTIRALRAIGVPAAKILVLINKVETDETLEDKTTRLIAAANAKGGRDNISVLLVQAGQAQRKPGFISRWLGAA